MQKKPTLAQTMTPFPHSVQVDSPIGDAELLMKRNGIHHLPVADGEAIVGIVTARDIATRRSAATTVRAYLTPDPYVVELSMPLDEVLFRLAERQMGCAIVTRQGKLAGIFTHVDACRSFAAHLRGQYPAPPADEVA